jgi:hypothetical protein
VPPEATAIGYAVTLSDDTEMPWANDVDISIPAGGGLEPKAWSVEVAREDAPAVFEGVSFAMTSPYRFQQTDTGWTYGEFATLEGKFNRPLQFSISHVSGSNHERRVCYKGTAESEPECSLGYDTSQAIAVSVPSGSYAVGYQIKLPAEAVGNDWSQTALFTLSAPGFNAQSQEATYVRPNEPYQSGSVASSFTSPYHYQQTDTGWTDGEFIALTGARNTDLTLRMINTGGSNRNRKACYKTVAGGQAICGASAQGTTYATVVVPQDAVEVGYQVYLPAEGVGPDWEGTDDIQLYGNGGYVFDVSVTVIRPNEPYQNGAVASNFNEFYAFQQSDTGWTYGEFIGLTGERNNELTFAMIDQSGMNRYRKLCYKVSAEAVPVCSPQKRSDESWITYKIPVEAVEIGYSVNWAAEAVGPDYEVQELIRLYATGSVLMLDQNVSMMRPNEPYQNGAVASNFTTPYSFQQTDSGWTYGEFITLTGERNVDLSLMMYDRGGNLRYRKACYKVAVDATPVCSDQKRSDTGWLIFTIPQNAVQVGYSVNLPAQKSGADDQFVELVRLYGKESVTLVNQDVTLIRPNAPAP